MRRATKMLPKKLKVLTPTVILAFLILHISVTTVYAFAQNPSDFLSVTSRKYDFVGTGTKEDPFLIASVGDLELLRDNVNLGVSYDGCYFTQTNDLFFQGGGQNWNPIGNVTDQYAFEGFYDGGGYAVYNIHCKDTYAGVFALLGGQVRNLGIESGWFYGDTAGSIASHGMGNADTRIINCYNKAAVTGIHRAGGIADNFGGQILFCWNFGTVSGEHSDTVTAGICSYGAKVVEGCHAAGPQELVDHSVYSGTVTDSFCLSAQNKQLTDALADVYLRMGEYSERSLVNWKNTVFPIVKDGELFFSRDVVPAAYWLSGIKGYLPEIFLSAVCAAFGIIFWHCFVMRANGCVPKPDGIAADGSCSRKKGRTSIWNRTNQKRAAAVMLTAVFFTAGFSFVMGILKAEYAAGVLNLQAYRKPENGKADILLLGGSSMSVNIELAQLWREFGIAGYCLGGGGSSMYDCYYRLLEAEKMHPTKMAVVEIRAVSYGSSYQGKEAQMENVSGLKFSVNKLRYIQAAVKPEDRIDFLLDFPLYHSRYGSLSKWDFLHGSSFGEYDKGTWTVFYGNPYTPRLEDISAVQGYRAVFEKQEYYLRRIMEYCGQKQIPLLLLKTPDANRKFSQPFYRAAGLIAKEYGVPFLDLNHYDQEIGLVPEDFYYDDYHLNVEGARKCTMFFGNYLRKHYGLADHRGDQDYKSWDMFAAGREDLYLREVTDYADYFAELKRDHRKLILIPFKLEKEETEMYLRLKNAWESLPYEITIWEETAYGSANRGNALDSHSICLGSHMLTSQQDYAGCMVTLDGTAVAALTTPGCLLVAYDETTGEIADLVGFAAADDFALKHFALGR